MDLSPSPSPDIDFMLILWHCHNLTSIFNKGHHSTLHRLKQSSTIFVICFGKICNRFGSYKTFNHDLVYWLVALSLENRPIKTLHPANTVFWLDNVGVRVHKLVLEMFMTTRTPLITGVNSVRISSSCFTDDTPRVTVKRHEHHMMLKFCWPTVCLNKYK
jgi:hypothetical protein